MRKSTALALWALAATVIASTGAAAEGTLSGKALAEELGKGGYVVYMRHTKTNKTEKDTDTSDLSNCATQRNLSDEGRAQAKVAATLFHKYGIKASAVLSSPYCRAMEASNIIFGKAEKAPELRYSTRLGPDEAEAAKAWLKAKLATAAAPGANIFLISHTSNLKDATGIWPKNDGDINVFKANGDGTYTHVGTITPEEWPGLLG